jgi:hypothetical protein
MSRPAMTTAPDATRTTPALPTPPTGCPKPISWLLQLHPVKNTFVLIVCKNTGKTYFAKLIENVIYFIRKIVKNTVFSWSQLQFANVCLWEEPSITQDNVCSAKLISEAA